MRDEYSPLEIELARVMYECPRSKTSLAAFNLPPFDHRLPRKIIGMKLRDAKAIVEYLKQKDMLKC